MDSFGAVELPSDDFELSLLTSEREAMTGFSNLATMLPLPSRGQAAPSSCHFPPTSAIFRRS